MKIKFNIGDTVRLKSSLRQMTVVSVGFFGEIDCGWMTEYGYYQTATFPTSALDLFRES